MPLLFSKLWKPFASQRNIITHPARFKTVCIGRRWGKTIAANRLIYRAALTDPGDYCWVAPSYDESARGIDAARQAVNPDFLNIRGKPAVGYCDNGSRIFYKSADDPDPKGIRGHGFRGVILDEAARIPKDAYDYVIRPTLADKAGWCMSVSTPKGRNWFFDQHTRGLDPSEDQYESWTFPSNSSPFFANDEWEEARRTLPEDTFRQEFEAEFLEDSAGVFRGVSLITGQSSCRHNGPYLLGCDLAKHEDFTVLISMCEQCGECIGFDRFNKIDWPIQKARIAAFCKRYPGRLQLDATGIGDPIYDDLRTYGLDVNPVKLTNTSKQQIIQDLIVSIEQKKIMIPSTWEIVINELKRYEYEYTAQRNIRYNAPAGYHDDCVIALALANRSRSMPGILMVM